MLLPATLGSVRYGSFTEMYEVLARLRGSGDLLGAIAVTEDHLGSFPHFTGLMHLIHAEVLVGSGRATEALDTLDRALRAGCRYPEKALRANRSLAAATDLPAFAEICARSQRQWEDAVASSSPQRTLLSPPNGTGDQLLVVLHGNNSDAAETLPRWSSAVDNGWARRDHTRPLLPSVAVDDDASRLSVGDRAEDAADVRSRKLQGDDVALLENFGIADRFPFRLADQGNARIVHLTSPEPILMERIEVDRELARIAQVDDGPYPIPEERVSPCIREPAEVP